jgi:HEPN domain-containing protein
MGQLSGQSVDPLLIFKQANCFYQALAILCNVEPENVQLAVTIGEPVMVTGALTIELFLKCLVCIETGEVPKSHNLRGLFDKLSDTTRVRIQCSWDNDILMHRGAEWDHIEARTGQKIARELPAALTAASKAFERIRYSYEGNTTEVQYFLQDLPQLLRRVIVEQRPEWKGQERLSHML